MMFSGIIEKIGIVSSAVSSHEGLDLKLQLPNDYLADVLSGDSVSVNGVCLTCVDIVDNYISFNLSPETLAQSSLGALTANNMVNIERALKLGDRLNGHLVSGHVDDVAIVLAINKKGNYYQIIISMPPAIAGYIVKKGSVTIDGVSLTVNECTSGNFNLMIVPYTFINTIIKSYNVGTKVNIEVDLIARYAQGLIKQNKN
jgi:riboflavin synthase